MVDATLRDVGLRFVVPGEPVAKARARTVTRVKGDGTKKTRTTTPKKTRSYEKKVRMCCAIAVNQARWTATKDDRFTVLVDIYRTHEGIGGDIDNVLKSILDAIQGEGLAMPDDRYVTDVIVSRKRDSKNPRVEVTVCKRGKVAA